MCRTTEPEIQDCARLSLVATACRWRKSASELSLLRQSCALSADAIQKCMRASHLGVSEHELAARFGAPSLYPPRYLRPGSYLRPWLPPRRGIQC